MKRGRPARRTPLKRTGFKQKRRTQLKRSKRIARRSKKQESRLNEYNGFRQEVLTRDNYVCRVCVLVRAGKIKRDPPHPMLTDQLQRIEVHHDNGRDGEHLCNLDECVTLCEWDHKYSAVAPHHRPKQWNEVKEMVMPWIKS